MYLHYLKKGTSRLSSRNDNSADTNFFGYRFDKKYDLYHYPVLDLMI